MTSTVRSSTKICHLFGPASGQDLILQGRFRGELAQGKEALQTHPLDILGREALSRECGLE